VQVSRFVLTAVGSLIVASSVLAQADDPPVPKPTGGIPTFNFDLRTEESTSPVLPFDQIFNVRAKVNAEVKTGVLRFWPKSTETETCAVSKAKLEKIIQGHRITRPNNDAELLFLMPAVDPNVDYCFAFQTTREVTPDEAKAFRVKARDLFDRATLTEGFSDVQQSERSALRERIATEMQKLGAQADSEIKEGTTFGKNPTPESLKAFNTLLQRISQANVSQKNDTDNYCGSRGAVLEGIEKMISVGEPARTLLVSLDAASKDQDNHALPKVMDAPAKAALDAILTKKDYKHVLKKTVDCDDIKAIKEPDEVDAIQHDLDVVQGQFGQISEFILALIKDDAAAKTVGISTKHEKTAAEDVAKQFENAAQDIGHLHSDMRNLGASLRDRNKALDAAADAVQRIVESEVTVLATSTSDFVTRHGFYATMDFGVASAWDIDEVVSYVGMNLYTRPINKQAPLVRGQKGNFRRRFSVTIGTTVQTLTKQGAYKGVLSDHALVGALGWRVLDSIKITAGGLLLKENDRNPLVDKTHLSATPFVAFSIDWDVRNTLKGLGSAFGVP
jgi:hypothetical protein